MEMKSPGPLACFAHVPASPNSSLPGGDDADASAANTGSGTLQLLLPTGWELQMDEVESKYTHMDERLDVLERQLLEMTRELRAGSASLTGGVTTISTGGAVGVGATTGIAPPPPITADLAPPAPAGTSGSGAGSHGVTPGPLAPSPHTGDPSQLKHSGVTVRGTMASTGAVTHVTPQAPSVAMPGSTSSISKANVMQEGLAAAAVARAKAEEAEEAEERAKQEEEQRVGNPLAQLAAAAKKAVDSAAAGIGSVAKQATSSDDAGDEKTETTAPAPAPAPAAEVSDPELLHQAAKDAAVSAAQARLVARAAAALNANIAVAADGSEKPIEPEAATSPLAAPNAVINGVASVGVKASAPLGMTTSAGNRFEGRPKPLGAKGKEGEGGSQAGGMPLLDRDSVYNFNRLQSAITELANSGYMESVKQLRETLLIQEWDMSNRHLAKRRAIAMFERYVAERDLVREVGGFAVLSALYEEPEALEELLPNDRMRMLCRSMTEECLNERRMQLYNSCNATAKEMATLTSSGMAGRVMQPLKQGVIGFALRGWGVLKSTFLPWAKFLP
ncbi:hypothetical protein QJQ45_029648 [Haematococcus lacustris]|nr:hypothetical protein QJQ45_029648 [Haematococcus lacustris]